MLQHLRKSGFLLWRPWPFLSLFSARWLSVVTDSPENCPVSSLGQSVNKFYDEKLNVMSNLQVHNSSIVCLPIWATGPQDTSGLVSPRFDQATGILSHNDVICVAKVTLTAVIDKPWNLCSTQSFRNQTNKDSAIFGTWFPGSPWPLPYT